MSVHGNIVPAKAFARLACVVHAGLLPAIVGLGRKRLVSAACHSLVRVQTAHTLFCVLAISPDGQLLAVISSASTSVNSPAQGGSVNGSALKDLPVDEPPVNFPGLEFSVSYPKGARLWDLATNTPRARLAVESRYITDGAFSPDGCLIAAAITDNTIQLWDTKADVLVGICKGHKQVVSAVAISPDGKTLASASEDGTLRFWNIATQQEFFSVPNLGDRVSGLNFSPDNRMLAATCISGTHAGHLRFYRTSPEGKAENGAHEQQSSTPSKAVVP